ncbi:MAG: ribosomal-protein-alanine N-acetyltransferase [Ruminococcaceae bacterium]|nr:ribosomal-protein-alanine N-acetyltransferase [Oscillospiraceae bacterium]
MKITVANPDQIDKIYQIENSSFTDPWSYKSFEEAIFSPNTTIYVVNSSSGDVLGFSCLLIIDYEAEILNIAVDGNYRKQGIGRLLAEHMINICISKEVEDIFLEVRDSNTAARGLYEKVGFKQIGRRKNYYSNPTEDAIMMKLSLQNDSLNNKD